MSKCFYVTYTNCQGASGDAYLCGEDLEYLPGGSCGGGYFSSNSFGYNAANASEQQGTVTVVACSQCPGCCNDPSLDPNQKFDCLNSNCIPAKTYSTPGKYANLAACEGGCAKDAACAGECVSKDEIAALQQAKDKLRSRLCK
jgi:hypothetical protein